MPVEGTEVHRFRLPAFRGALDQPADAPEPNQNGRNARPGLGRGIAAITASLINAQTCIFWWNEPGRANLIAPVIPADTGP